MILLLGSNGYVGKEFVRQLSLKDQDFKVLKHQECEDELFLRTFMKDNKIDRVINSAGYVGNPNVDACETQREETFEGNVLFPMRIKRASEGIAVYGHVSTGCIYNEKDPENPVNCFTEEDRPNFDFSSGNSSFYSGTKSLAETLLTNYENHETYIWRLRMPFEDISHRKNLLTKLQNYSTIIKARNSISRLSDFVRCCLESFEKQIPYGIYNVTNGGSVYFPDLFPKRNDVKYVSVEEMNKEFRVPRSNCVLSNEKLKSTGIQIDDIDISLERSFVQNGCF
jgi:dTDP-4-dehydrorhamnose reductase